MQRIDNPTFKSRNGKIFTKAVDAAREDALEYFTGFLEQHEGESMSVICHALAKEWTSVLSRLDNIRSDLASSEEPTSSATKALGALGGE